MFRFFMNLMPNLVKNGTAIALILGVLIGFCGYLYMQNILLNSKLETLITQKAINEVQNILNKNSLKKCSNKLDEQNLNIQRLILENKNLIKQAKSIANQRLNDLKPPNNKDCQSSLKYYQELFRRM